MAVTERERPTAPRRGPAPYGWTWIGGKLTPVPREQHVRWLVLHMSGELGWSLARIAEELRSLRIHNREGQGWARSTLHRVVQTAAQLENTG